jgi:hypothetical protein
MTRSRDTQPSTVPAPQRAREPVPGEDAANELTNAPGSALPTTTRQAMESRFDTDFSDVRIHTERPAAETANALGARAFTIGKHIAFSEGEYAPPSAEGRRLLSHELAHVVQQRGASGAHATLARNAAEERAAGDAAERAARGLGPVTALGQGGALRIQRDDKPPTKADAGQKDANQTPQGVRITFVLRAPDDTYTKDVTDYVRNTLKDQVVEVDNLQEAAEYLEKYAKVNKTKVNEVRLIGHGSTTGGIKMTPKGETGPRFITAEELEQMSADTKLKSAAGGAMADGATVEFWGCNVGGTEKTGKAMSSIFNADFKAPEDTLRTSYSGFSREAEKGEKGEVVQGRTVVTVKSTQEIDDRVAKGNKALGSSFNAWLVAQSKKLEADGDLPAQPDDQARIAEMRKTFDRSGGNIKRLQIESKGKTIEKSDKRVYGEKWKTVRK